MTEGDIRRNELRFHGAQITRNIVCQLTRLALWPSDYDEVKPGMKQTFPPFSREASIKSEIIFTGRNQDSKVKLTLL